MNFFFSFERKFEGGKRQLFSFFLGRIDVLRGLIYVDVSLHSNKKKNPEKLPVLVSVECFSRTPSFHHAAANRRPAWEAFLCGSRS